jgi:hypothetical protein
VFINAAFNINCTGFLPGAAGISSNAEVVNLREI